MRWLGWLPALLTAAGLLEAAEAAGDWGLLALAAPLPLDVQERQLQLWQSVVTSGSRGGVGLLVLVLLGLLGHARLSGQLLRRAAGLLSALGGGAALFGLLLLGAGGGGDASALTSTAMSGAQVWGLVCVVDAGAALALAVLLWIVGARMPAAPPPSP